ncbi:peptidylprolyl isomerase [Winogradskyella aurantiaca]|uniref:peptidylprolyl isomerase n=1 Tax=Winogradskyella aurantiaca TaxID=2219558 RepID=UPI000E1DEF8A|nr:SurA N-terminal domain-containing protein [Winogradskyella aurantiaca]
MAVLNKIRQRSVILILVIALALFSFVIGDLFKNSDALTGGNLDVIATVNGEDIKRDEFMFNVENMQRRMGPGSTSIQTMNNVYNQELRRIILNSEYETLGLSVERDQMRELLETSFSFYPEFQNQDSIFDVNRLNAFISNLKEISPERAPLGTFMINYDEWTNNEQNLASNSLQTTYYNLIKAGLSATLTEAKEEYLSEAKTVNLQYVQIPYTTIPDSLVQVSKEDIKAYMQLHADKYQVEASRDITFVEFREEASEADRAQIQADLIALKHDKIEYVEAIKATDTVLGFDNTDNIEAFVNSNSDIRYNDRFLRSADLSTTIKDTIFNVPVSEYYGPYEESGYYKLTKILAKEEKPDSVKVRHILIPYIGSTRALPTVTETPEEAKAKADSILNVLKGNRSKFVDLLDLSSDLVTNENEGVLEFAYNSPFAPEFSAFSFDNKVGDMDVVETSFGFHVIEILDQMSINSAIKMATVATQIEPSEQTIDDVFNSVSKFEIALENGNFEELATEYEKNIRRAAFEELDENVPGLGSQRQVVRWAFDEETELGDTKRFSISGVGFIVAKLGAINDKGLMKVENATTPVLAEIRKEKKAELIKEKITGTTLSEIANGQGQSVRSASAVSLSSTTLSGAGVEPKVIGSAFGLAEGAISKPIAGDKGIYLVEITKINDADELDNYAAIASRLSNSLKATVNSKVYTALQEAAEIEDNRAKTVY